MDLYYLMMNLMMDQWNHVVATQRYAACIHLANYEGPEAMQDRVNIARQTAMHMMWYSANAWDVHLLRALSLRSLGAG